MEEISKDILERAKDGDLRAFHEIYKSSSGFVYSLAMRMIQNTTDAEEVTQDVFVKIYKSLKQYEGRSSFKTWIYRITMNTVINFCKKRSSDQKKKNELLAEKQDVHSENQAKKNLMQETTEQALKEILVCLNEDQRACILLREIEGLDYQQIADTLKINLNTVRSRLKRARETMIIFARQKGVQNEMRPI